MTEPDELYTLRAQYWMGHYHLALDEAKSIARRPMSPALKAEREELIQRAHLALGDFPKVIGGDTPALKALALRAQYDQAPDDDSRTAIANKMKEVLATETPPSPSLQLYASQLFLSHGWTKDALQCVHAGATLEHVAMTLQIYLKLDRLDLAQNQLRSLQQQDEDAVLTQLGSVFVSLATGSSSSGDAIHVLASLKEQYGPSPLLQNLSAASYVISGQYEEAETSLIECRKEFPDQLNADTLINLVVCQQHQGKDPSAGIMELKQTFPSHPYCQALDRVTGAFERESLKYKV
eukprot:CAMPEP_0194032446 /NCGR_PEP_ID=MMETSP0009_2-20130614/5383_1 /TAXON_ID=210454 /ORGANISM="Grammatophora oceanica, Strain CCMP 410" /LENGTH=292 /DNA_ID=CAMNT_0038672893 /DNA_START=64 /DNA_END=942 /DNA_ORIENTATION=+